MIIDSNNNSVIADDKCVLIGDIETNDIKIYKENSFLRFATDYDINITYRDEIKMLNILLDCKRERKEK